jgi:hypothetical protein
MEVRAEDDCCPAGDITVTPVPSGFMIGRAMAQEGPGPWWQYIRVMVDYNDAVTFAREIASEDRAQAWLYKDGKYISLGGSDSPGPAHDPQNSRPN